jgi:hypothetical protein
MRPVWTAVMAGMTVWLLAGCSAHAKKDRNSIACAPAVGEHIPLDDLDRALKRVKGADTVAVPKPLLQKLIEENKRVQAENEGLVSQLRAIKNIDLEERERLHPAH